ncbi:hypothetical protein L1987_21274 [Smallanthus sonchifolius]|uniref:Uncharacterized protein n=1 Tax=Smallanthus sonchifolius TaxID=185202 RepID=A0ACB9IW23_9ASTR|nr:hypothetical protein L1987_21274 [Smallanthus sonchifolius]
MIRPAINRAIVDNLPDERDRFMVAVPILSSFCSFAFGWVTVGGNLVLVTNYATSRNIDAVFNSSQHYGYRSDTPGPHSVAQTIPRTTETASNEVISVLVVTNFYLL